MTPRIRLLIAIFLLLAILCVCVAHFDTTSVLATALRAAQAALSVMLGLTLFALLARPWLDRDIVCSGLLAAASNFYPPPKPRSFSALTC